MKRLLMAFPLGAALVLASCGSDSGTSPLHEGSISGTMTASIDGSSWSASSGLEGVILHGGAGFAGTDAQGRLISIGVMVSQGTGTFTIGGAGAPNATLTIGSSVWNAGPGTGSGSVTLTTVTDTRLVGTFQFEVAAFTQDATPETRSITGGAFDLTFPDP
jgi:hypothetical protein